MLNPADVEQIEIVNDFQEKIMACDSIEKADAVLTNTLNTLGISQFIYVYYSKKLPKDDDLLHMHCSPDKLDWFAYYHEHGLHKKPFAGMMVFRSMQPMIMNVTELSRKSLIPGMRKFSKVALEEFGINSVAIFTLFGSKGGVAVLLVYHDDIAALLEKNKFLCVLLNQIGLYYHYHIANLTHNILQAKENLTKRESECLAWTARNKSVEEISSLIGRTERTVNFHLSNVNKKLKTKNKYQAAAKALALGLIDI